MLVGFLAVGLGLWVWILSPSAAPQRLPLAQQPSGPGAPAQGAAPANHPPKEIPPDVKKYIADLEQKAAADPANLEAWRTTAQVEYRAGQVDGKYLTKAEASFRHVLELDGKNLEAMRGLGNVHFDRTEYARAVELYARYLAIKPDDVSVRTDLGTMYLYGGDADKAIAEYGKALAKDPKFFQAHYNLGVAYAEKRDTTKALAALSRARDLAPEDAARRQIQAMIDHVNGSSAAAAAPAAASTLQGMVEESLRAHPIAGPKVVAFEWPSPAAGRVRLREFPMSAMPEGVRQKFLDRVKGLLADAKREHPGSGAVTLDLVDEASGQVMATVATE